MMHFMMVFISKNQLKNSFAKLLMDSNMDMNAYTKAITELKINPVQGPHGTYHVKNGVIYYGYNIVGTEGFAVSQHYWNIFH